MLPRHPRTVSSALALLALALVLPYSARLVAAENTRQGTARGKLSDDERLTTPVVEPASEEPKLAIGKMKLPAGLTAHLWAAEPMLANPVAFALDEKGRVFVSETYRYGSSTLDIRAYMWMLEDDLANRNQADWLASIERNFGPAGTKELSKESEVVRLLEDTNGDGVADKSSVYAEGFRGPMDGVASGVLPYRGQVWFTNIPALWKFTGRDKAETRTEVFRGFGVRFNYTGHDLHGLTLGPDGRLYFSIGDRGSAVTTKEGTAVNTPDTGAVFRCWPDGSGFEVFASGLRNPQSLAFNEYGDLFTGDNDSDQGDEERLVHLVEGGDSGWRVGYQFSPRGNAGPWNTEKLWHPRHAGQPAYHLAPLVNIEDGPSGIAYYPGTGLTPEYAGHLFITHFKGAISNSGIFSYKLKPDGATYAVDRAAPFLTGALPTDVRFGPDGKMYYSDWAEGWPKSKRGRIYSIYDEKLAGSSELKAVKDLIASDFTKKSDDELAKLLGHADWRVRLEAQYSLAERGTNSVPTLKSVAGNNTANPLARRHALWGLGQIAHKDATLYDFIATLTVLRENNDDEIRAQAAKLIGDDPRGTTGPLVSLLNSETSSARVSFFAAQSLGKLKHAPAVPALITAIRTNNDADAYLRHALVLALSQCATAEQLAALASDESTAVRLAAILALRRQASPAITAFLTDKDPLLLRETATAINDAPIADAYPALAALASRSNLAEPVLLRALNAHFRLGKADNAAALATFAAGNGPAAMRREALTLLSLWPKPPARDRVVGVFRPLGETTRPVAEAVAALTPILPGLFGASTPDNVQLAAIAALTTLELKDSAAALAAIVADQAQSAGVRSAALKAIDELTPDQVGASAELAAISAVPDLRLTALPIVTRLHPDSAVAQLSALIAGGTAGEQQTAFRALGEAKDPRANDLLLAQLGQLAAGGIAPAARLDLLEAAALRTDPRIKQALAAREAALAKDPDPLAPFRVCLEGGDARRANRTVRNNPVVQCIRCHRVDEGGGGDAGPHLAGIGARVPREYLLESLIKPSAKIAAGFEIVSVTKTNGENVVGTLLQRDAAGLKLKVGETDIVTIPAAQVKTVESGPSGMPEIVGLVLTKAEIRDVIAYLSNLKEPVKTGAFQSLRALRKPEGK